MRLLAAVVVGTALIAPAYAGPPATQLDHFVDTGVVAFHGVLTPQCDGACDATYVATFTGVADVTYALPPGEVFDGPMTATVTVSRTAATCAAVSDAAGTFAIQETGAPYSGTLTGTVEWTRVGAAGAATMPTMYGYPLRTGTAAGPVTFAPSGSPLDPCAAETPVAVTGTLAVVAII